MLGVIEKATVTITVSGMDIIALKKLSLVSHALSRRLDGQAGREQTTLANTLDDVIRNIELAVHGPQTGGS